MNIQVIGSVAKEMLGQAQSATVLGSSRRGVFLSLDCGWVVFLSHEAQHGPLTLNLGDSTDLEARPLKGITALDLVPTLRVGTSSQRSALGPGAVQRGASKESDNAERCHKESGAWKALTSSPKFLNLGEAGKSLLFEMDHALVWHAPPRPPRALPAGQRQGVLARAIEQAMTIRQTDGLAALQAVLAGRGNGAAQCNTHSAAAGIFYPHLARIAAQPANRLDPLSLEALLGLGSGLTPSGDDIVLGLLLALNRWGDVLAPGLERPAFNRAVLALAYARTTTLSANLIECASRGQADERLVTALDGLVTGVPGAESAAALLAGWGSSSGLDALCGMACILV